MTGELNPPDFDSWPANNTIYRIARVPRIGYYRRLSILGQQLPDEPIITNVRTVLSIRPFAANIASDRLWPIADISLPQTHTTKPRR